MNSFFERKREEALARQAAPPVVAVAACEPVPEPSPRAQPIPGLANFKDMPDEAFVRAPVVCALFGGISRVTLWRAVQASRIPAPKRLSARMAAWNVGELRAALRNM